MKKWLKISLWILFGVTVLVLMSIVKKTQNESIIDKPNIIIHVNGENAFLTEDELYTRLKRKGFVYNGQIYRRLKVNEVEKYLTSMSEIKSAKVFTKIGSKWTIEVEIRKPIARIFNNYGESFYLDELGYTMSPSNLYTARVVIVTGDIPDRINSKSVPEIINNRVLKSKHKLDDLYRISHYVCSDQLLQALVGQIHLKKNGDFVLIPEVGGQKIIFGSAHTDEEVRGKFKKLKVFYKEAMPYEGWGKYDEISLKYDKQIVCKKKD
jgi:cell division protein FtsQ